MEDKREAKDQQAGAEPSAGAPPAEPQPVEPEETPTEPEPTPSSGAKQDAGEGAEDIPVVNERGIPYYELWREDARKTEAAERRAIEAEEMLRLARTSPGYGQPVTQPAPAPGQPDPMEAYRTKLGMESEGFDALRDLVAANAEAYAAPYLATVANMNIALQKANLKADNELYQKYGKKWEKEIDQILDTSSFQQRMHPQVVVTAFNMVLGRHLPEVMREVETKGAAEGAKNRRITGEAQPSATGRTTPAKGAGPKLSAEEKAIADATWPGDPKRYERYAKSKARMVKLNQAEKV